MSPPVIHKFETLFFVFVGGVIGFIGSIFFLHFVYYKIIGSQGFGIMSEINLVSFFSESFERQLEAGGIIFAAVLLGISINILVLILRKNHSITKKLRILEDLDKTRTEFILMASHQLRTPLSAIKWSIGMLLKGDFGKLTNAQVEVLDKMYTRNDRLVIFTSELLNVAQLESKRIKITPKPVSLTKFESKIKKIVTEFASFAEGKDLHLVFNSSVQNIPSANVQADMPMIEQVVQSFIENAISYSPRKGDITVSLELKKKKMLVKVTDTGIGIPKGEQSKIFSKFFRGSNAFRIRSVGTGLGLYLSKLFIKEHGGEIWFDSEENKGTTFYFTLIVKFGEPTENFLSKL